MGSDRQSARRDERRRVSARDRANNADSGFARTFTIPEGFELFKESKGRLEFDIIPYIAGKGNPQADEGMEYFERTFYIHRDIGPAKDSYICPAKTAGKPCPICEQVAKWSRKSGISKEEQKELRQMAAKQRQLFIIRIPGEKTWYLWSLSYHNFGKQLDARIKAFDEKDGYDYFYDLQEGFTVRASFVEASMGEGNPFPQASVIDFIPRAKQYKPELIDRMPCLDDLLIIEPYEKLRDLFLGVDGPEDGDDDLPPARGRAPQVDDEDDTPPPPAAGKGKARPAPVADDTDEDDAPPAPAKKSKKPAAPADEGEWDDEDDTPPAKPAGKKKPAAPPPEDDEDDAPPAPAKKAKKPSVDDEGDWDEDDAPPAKPAGKKKPAPAPAEDDGDDDDAPPAKAAKPAKGKPKPPADDDDWE